MIQAASKTENKIRVWAHKRGYFIRSDLSKNLKAISVRCAYGHEFELPVEFLISLNVASNKSGDCQCCRAKQIEEAEQAQRGVLEAYARQHQGEFLGWDPLNRNKVLFRCQHGHDIVKAVDRVKSAVIWCEECVRQEFNATSPTLKKAKRLARFDCALLDKGYTKVHPDVEPDPLNRFLVRCANGHEHWMDYLKTPVCIDCKKIEFDQRLDAVERKVFRSGLKPLGRLVSLGDRLNIECPEGHTFSREGYHILSNPVQCPDCVKEAKARLRNSTRTAATEEAIRRLGPKLSNRGFSMVAPLPLRTNSHLTLRCSKGHEFKKSLSAVRPDSLRCPICDSPSERLKIQLKQQGWVLVKPWLGYGQEVDIECGEGHRFQVSATKLLTGRARCKTCFEIFESNRRAKLVDEILHEAVAMKVTVMNLPEATNGNLALDLRCQHGHTYQKKVRQFIDGASSCPVCRSVNRGKKLAACSRKPKL